MFFIVYCSKKIQSTIVISTSVISNNRLSRRKNLVLVITQKSKIRFENIVEKRRNCSILWKRGEIAPYCGKEEKLLLGEQFLLFSTIFSIYISNQRSQITRSFVKFGCSIGIFLSFAHLICRSTDISELFFRVLSISR